MEESYKQGYLDGIQKAVSLFNTHEEGWGRYCDTGEDMEWSCRSECVSHGVDRCRKHYQDVASPQINQTNI